MPLEPIKLDDLTWSDLTTAARDRIAGVSTGEWTLHAPVDPGITLLELFASQLEQRLFWMDQPSDELTAAMLSLLGLRPKPERVAGTVFCFANPEHSAGHPKNGWIVPADTVMQHELAGSVLRFRTTQAVQLLPIEWNSEPGQPADLGRTRSRRRSPARCQADLRLRVGYEEKTADLQNGRMPCLLPSNGAVIETRVAIRLTEAPEDSFRKELAQSDASVGLLFELDTPEQIEPQWLSEDGSNDDQSQEGEGQETRRERDADPAKIAPPASLSWSFAFNDSEQPFATNELHKFTTVEDGTGGFRRSGIVRLNASDLARTRSRNGPNPKWLVIVVRARRASFSYLPRVRQIAPNAVLAEHRVKYRFSDFDADESLTKQVESWKEKRLPGSRLQLDFEPDERPIANNVQLQIRERVLGSTDNKTNLETWHSTGDFSHHGPEDRVFVVDRDRGRLSFGDGLNGRLPIPERASGPDDEPGLFVFDIDVGGGASANIDSCRTWTALSLFALSIERGPRTPGEFRLGIDGKETEPIEPSASAQEIKAAILQLPGVREGDVVCSRGPLPGAVWIHFPRRRNLRLTISDVESESAKPRIARAVNASNVVAAQGGEDAEALEEAKRRSKSEFRRSQRAVTKADIERLAQQTPGAGIKRAHAAVGLHPQHACIPTPGAVTVFIVPDLPPSLQKFRQRSCGDDLIALQPDPGAMSAVWRWLNSARLVTHEIYVCRPAYEPIDLSVVITGTPVDPDATTEMATQALHEYLHPLYGGPNGNGWPFGSPLRPSELIRVLRETLNSELSVEEVGVRKRNPDDSTPRHPRAAQACCTNELEIKGETLHPFETCSDVEIDPHGLVALRNVRIAFLPPRAQTGGLL